MEGKAVGKFLRISPFKVRRIANEIRNMGVLDAEAYLSVMPNKGAALLKKIVHSARSNILTMDKNIDEEDIIISKILIDGGPIHKRFHPISRGRASKILKRTSHITVEVKKKEGAK